MTTDYKEGHYRWPKNGSIPLEVQFDKLDSNTHFDRMFRLIDGKCRLALPMNTNKLHARLKEITEFEALPEPEPNDRH